MNRATGHGIPTTEQVLGLLDSREFKTLEGFSDRFLKQIQPIAATYRKNWVADPLHQWSRRWEYPYVFESVHEASKTRPNLRILDAGSGMTFFPFLLENEFDRVTVECCDNDPTLDAMFSKACSEHDYKVNFHHADLRSLPFDDQSFDVVYCVSVLEHTDDYVKILNEFSRVLRPGGIAIITYDISIDGNRDIHREDAKTLYENIKKQFPEVADGNFEFGSSLDGEAVYSTHVAKNKFPDSLPWRYPSSVYQIRNFAKTFRWIPWPPKLTCCCVTATKSAK